MSDNSEKIVELLDVHGGRLHRLLVKLTANRCAADELLQEIFLRLLKSRALSTAQSPEAYPNEIRSAFDAKMHVDSKKSVPVTPLLTFTLDHLGGKDKNSKGRVKMRFWIDSDSRPCMSDISVAESYDFLSTDLRYTPQQSTPEGFTHTFESYDGSGRYHFVDGYFDGTGRLGF